MTEEKKVSIIEHMAMLEREAQHRLVNDAFEKLVDKQDRRIIPEVMFQEHFLPYFSGQQNLDENPDVLRNWITIAGSGFAEVNIVNQEGEVVGVVPGLNSTLGFQMSNSNVNLNNVMRQVELVRTQNPTGATELMVGALVEHTDSMFSDIVPDTASVTAEKWRVIFERYGVGMKKESTQDIKDEVRLDEDVDFKT